ncbi:lipoprotein-releasing ABC transporter permease subunit LolC [Arsenophonus symbiont of Ornithomya chloropus]|uniref:lipoprotein-releasing ABC transporter permease subunit LolC n=1 Tax=Arsenophonus symbiont of Ornithomya chloropus TaxID=634121 RepID=UPI0032B23EA4
MLQFIIYFVGLRYMFKRKGDRFSQFILILSIIGIALGVMSLIIVTSVMNGAERAWQNNILAYMPQVILTTSQGNINPEKYSVKKIKHLKEIDRITSIVESDVILQSKENVAISVMIGTDEKLSDPLFKHLQNLDPKVLKSSSYNVILGIKLAEKLKVQPGDQLRLIVPSVTQFTLIGRMPSQRLFTVAGFFSTQYEADSTEILVNLEDAARLMHYPIGNITGWRLYLKKPLMVDILSKKKLLKDMIWKDWRERKGDFFHAVKMEKNIMILLLSLIIILAAFNIITSLSLLVMQKQLEIAIFQILGLKHIKIIAIFMLQGIGVGIFGTIIGILLGLFITNNLNIIMPMLGLLDKNIELKIFVDFISIMSISLFSIIIALLATLYPAYRAVTIQPTEALRYA